jgi:WhiB family redox-sensing transcriptional regulator
MTAPANWRDDAACRNADPELFFPLGTAGPALGQVREARRICQACRAQTQCLAWALDNEVTDGVWGGTTEDERRVIRSLCRRMPANPEDTDGESYRPPGHSEHGIRAQAARTSATRSFRDTRAGSGPDETGAKVTDDEARRQSHPIRSGRVHHGKTGSYGGGGFARDFATSDGERVRVEASTRRQFADLARTTGLAQTFAFLERLVHADLSTCAGLYTHRGIIATLLAPWFARQTVAELADAFAGTSVQWAHLPDLTGSVRHANRRSTG